MLSEQLDRARLWSLVAYLLRERDAGTDGQPAECAAKHAIAMKIDLMTIGSFQESELAGRIDRLHGSDRLIFVLLYQPLQTSHMILQASSRVLERVIDGE